MRTPVITVITISSRGGRKMGHCRRWAWPTLGELRRNRRVEDTKSGHEDDRFVGVARMRGHHGVAPPDILVLRGRGRLALCGRFLLRQRCGAGVRIKHLHRAVECEDRIASVARRREAADACSAWAIPRRPGDGVVSRFPRRGCATVRTSRAEGGVWGWLWW